jgi:glutathione synthase/RimK-type ligase-like ATP-grasp enzyme
MHGVVLIHASTDDVHADAVANCLRNMDVEVCVLAREKCFQEWHIECRGDEVAIQTADETWTAKDIRSVHWRRDFIAEPAWCKWDGITAEVAAFLAEQRSIHVESAFKRIQPEVPFINEIDTNRLSSSKVLQHHMARRCGLNVPPTYVGTDPVKAESFAQDLWGRGRRCCTKNIESSHVEISGVKHARLTRLFCEANLHELQGLPAGPIIFQEYVEKKYEYRVTVVGREVHACRIDSQAAGGDTAIDWRHYDIPKTPHYAASLPQDLQDRLVQLVGALGLTFGAVDLIEDSQGEFYFLEVNSMGQWLWIEDLTELPISQSIARHLAEPALIRRRVPWNT